MVQSMPSVLARKADFAQISLADQLQLVATDTDILVGEYTSIACWGRRSSFMPEMWVLGMLCGGGSLSTTAAPATTTWKDALECRHKPQDVLDALALLASAVAAFVRHEVLPAQSS